MGLIEAVTVLAIIIYNYIIAAIRVFIPPPRKSIEGEIVLITGAGHGIGREFALEISKLGAICVLWDINKENNEKVANEIRSRGGRAHTYVADVRSFEDVQRKAEQVREDVGDVTILINNAGILNGGWFLDLKEEDIRRTFEVNSLAHFWTCKAFLPAMIKAEKGHILNVVSMVAFAGTALLVDYSASKSAAFGFSESLREELSVAGYKGINISALCPYFVTTGLVKSFEDKPGAALDAHATALNGIDGMLRNYEIIYSPSNMFVAHKIGAIFPRKTNHILRARSGTAIHEQYSKRQ